MKIKFSDKTGDNAILLLAAAEKLGLDQSVVRTTSNSFDVPDEVAKEAGLDGESTEAPAAEEPKKAPAKKTAAKKTTARKTAAKKSTAKKTK